MEKIQRPIFFIALASGMLGVGAKSNLSSSNFGDYISLQYFLSKLDDAPFFAWTYWCLIAAFGLSFTTCMIMEYLKRWN